MQVPRQCLTTTGACVNLIGAGQHVLYVTPERWLPVPEYEGLYEASSFGRVRSLPHMVRTGVDRARLSPGRILRPAVGKNGHLHVNLYRENRRRTFELHVLVARAFIGPRPAGQEVRHLDGNAANNAPANLRYGTHGENQFDQVRHGTHRNASATHCPNGHEYTGENTYILPKSGGRVCRTCAREYAKKRLERKRTARAARKKAAAGSG